MAEHSGARFPARQLFQPGGYRLSDAAEPLHPSRLAALHRHVAPSGLAPSATTTMACCRLRWWLASRCVGDFSSGYGISGIRIASARPAMPACSAIHPGVATHDLDDQDAAVSLSRGMCSRSMHSVANDNRRGEAEGHAKVDSRSLSIVFGTPTTRRPFLWSWSAMVRLPSPPTEMCASILCFRKARSQGRTVRFARRSVRRLAPPDLERIPAIGGAEDGAA